MEKDKETYTLEVWTGAGKEYREVDKAEMKEYIKNSPDFFFRFIDVILNICEASKKHNEAYLRYDIDCICTEAHNLHTYLALMIYDKK